MEREVCYNLIPMHDGTLGLSVKATGSRIWLWGECDLTSLPPPRAAHPFLAGIDSSPTDGGGHALMGETLVLAFVGHKLHPRVPRVPLLSRAS